MTILYETEAVFIAARVRLDNQAVPTIGAFFTNNHWVFFHNMIGYSNQS